MKYWKGAVKFLLEILNKRIETGKFKKYNI